MFSAHRLPGLVVAWLLLTPLIAVAEDSPSLSETERKEILAYGLGYNIAGRLILDYPDLDAQSFINGLNAAFNGEKPPYEAETVRRVLAESNAEVTRRREERAQQTAMENRERSQAFLKDNAQDPEVKLLGSGIQYKVLREGEGIKPKLGDTVRVHFEGKLIDGSVFDTTRNGTAEEGVKMKLTTEGSMTGALEGITRMRRGAIWRLFIPPEQGFGSVGSNTVGPNQVLIYDVELLEVLRGAAD